jgi:superfamily II DNA or RNA helicase
VASNGVFQMDPRASRRIYTVQGLAYWLDRLDQDWEVLFSSNELKRGRQIYRSGEVREIEFRVGSAVMHCVTGGEEGYAVVDGQEKALQVRYSIEDKDLGRSMAVAGLYELEEVLGEEVPYLLFEGEERTKEEAHAPPPGQEEEQAPEPGRPFSLDFRLEKGRELEARLKLDGSHFAASGEKDALIPSERADLVRLIAMARQAGFQYSRKREALFINDVEVMLNFFQVYYPSWKKRYPVEMDDASKHLAHKPAIAEISAVAEKAGGNGISLRWKYRAGNRFLSDSEMEQLMKSRRELSIIPGKGFVRLPDARRRTYLQWQETESGFPSGELPGYMLYSLAGVTETRIKPDDAAGKWQDALLADGRSSVCTKELELLPALRPYQREGVRWLQKVLEMGCHCLLADEMGLGKTLQLLSLLHNHPRGKGGPALVVCPASVVPVWEAEARKFYRKLKIRILKSGENFSNIRKQPDLWVASYTQLRRHKHLLKDVRFGLVILDEAQNIKNPDTKVTQACFSIQGKHRFVVTGTPVENSPLDLWTLFRFLMPGLLGGRREFEEALAGNKEGFLGTLRTQVRPFILRRTKAEVASDLPEKVEMVLRCPMSEEQSSLYTRILQQGVEEMGEDVQEAMSSHSMGFLALLTRLRQVSVDPCLLPSRKKQGGAVDPASGKVGELLRRLEELLAMGHKVVVFSQFVTFLKALRPAVEGIGTNVKVFELHGGTKDRGKLVRSFQTRKGAGVFLVSLRAGGTGITLSAADYVFLMDPWWNPAVEKQAIDRVHRIGQDKTVFVFRMIAAGTVEERIQDLQQEKETTFAELIGELEGKLAGGEGAFGNLRKLLELQG